MLTAAHVSEMLGVAKQTLARWRDVGGGPKFVKIGVSVRYPAEEVAAFVAAQTRRSSTSDTDETRRVPRE